MASGRRARNVDLDPAGSLRYFVQFGQKIVLELVEAGLVKGILFNEFLKILMDNLLNGQFLMMGLGGAEAQAIKAMLVHELLGQHVLEALLLPILALLFLLGTLSIELGSKIQVAGGLIISNCRSAGSGRLHCL